MGVWYRDGPLCFFFETVSQSHLSWPRSYHINQAGLKFREPPGINSGCLELLSVLLQRECWDCRCMPPCPVYAVPTIKPRASCLLNKHFTTMSYISNFFPQHIPSLTLVFLGKSDAIMKFGRWKRARLSSLILFDLFLSWVWWHKLINQSLLWSCFILLPAFFVWLLLAKLTWHLYKWDLFVWP